jgi:hypothetical protein
VHFRRYWKLELFLRYAKRLLREAPAGLLRMAMFPESEPDSRRSQFTRYKNNDEAKDDYLHICCAAEMNAILEKQRERARNSRPFEHFDEADLARTLFSEFARKLGRAIDRDDPDAYNRRAHLQSCLVNLLQPSRPPSGPGRLRLVRHSSADRFTEHFPEPDDVAPVDFGPNDEMEIQLHNVADGQLYFFVFVVRDSSFAPKATDPSVFAWETCWGDTVRWLNSPSRIRQRGAPTLVVPRTKVVPLSGRFTLYVVIAADKAVADRLSASGDADSPTLPDEDRHLLFLRALNDLPAERAAQISIQRASYTISLS